MLDKNVALDIFVAGFARDFKNRFLPRSKIEIIIVLRFGIFCRIFPFMLVLVLIFKRNAF